jgi:hypothetical protein
MIGAVRWLVAVALLAASGCIIWPKTTTSTRSLGTVADPPVRTAPGGLTVQARWDGQVVHLSVFHADICTQRYRENVETSSSTHADFIVLGAGGGDLGAALVVILFEPVVLLVSGSITAIAVASSSDTSHVDSRVVSAPTFMCPTPVTNAPIHVTFPSAAEIDGVTDLRGLATFNVLPGEPARGNLLVTVEDVTRAVPYVHQ